MSQSLYLIDGHAQIFRAYYAPFRNLSAPTGEPTRATFIFFQMLINLIRERKPDAVAMVMDVSDGTVFRREIDPEYKAHREPPPEDLPVQIDRIVSTLEALGMPILRVPGFEADDIIATLARRMGPDWHVYMVSKDKDLDQLLTPHVSLYDPGRNQVITHDQLFELKGWTPQQAIDAQTLIGDTVDNVRGVPGIGPKTAAKLLQKYGNLAGVMAHADDQSPKQRDALRDFASRMESVRQLVTLRTDVPVELDIATAGCERLRWRNLVPVFIELGLRRLLERLPEGTTQPENAPATPDRSTIGKSTSSLIDVVPPTAPLDEDQNEAPAAVTPAMPSAYPTEQLDRLRLPDGGRYELIDTPAKLAAIIESLQNNSAFAIDTETTGLHPIDSDLVGISLAWEVGAGCYLPIRSSYGEVLPIERVQRELGPLLSDPKRTKVGHHLKYDLQVLRQAGFTIQGPLFDTLIAAFVLEPQMGSLKLDSLAARLLGHTMIPITDLIGKGRDQLRMDQVPLAHVSEYASEDADYTWRLFQLFSPALEQSDMRSLFYDTEMPLVSVLMNMEAAGISLDTPFLEQLGVRMKTRCSKIMDEVCKLAGGRFNLDSPKQLAEVLFDKLGFRVVRKTRTTRSTDAETLETLASETGNPILNLLLEYRETQKLLGTYVEALPRTVSRRSGRIHTSYSQTGAITGRLSSSDPNLQNIPIRTEAGREIRRAFVARDADHLLLSADYSQVELRVLAHFSHDEQLIEAFAADRDIHAFVASQIANVPLAAVTKEMRSRAKAVNFGIVYGQSAFGLAQATGMSQSDARKFIDDYFRRYPRIRGFIDDSIESARQQGFVRTILGRRRYIGELHSANRALRSQGERLAVNTIIQGSAADLIKTAMIQIHNRISSGRLPIRMLLQVHDELVFELAKSQVEPMTRIIAGIMEGALPLTVPLKVDVAVGFNWLEAK